MVSLRQSILEKDNQIASLRSAAAQVNTDSGQKNNLAASDNNDASNSPLKLSKTVSVASDSKRRGPPSPD